MLTVSLLRLSGALLAFVLAGCGPMRSSPQQLQPLAQGQYILTAPLPRLFAPGQPVPGDPDALVRLHERPDSEAVIAELAPRLRDLPPGYIYEYARRMFEMNAAEGFKWFWVGTVRARYDALRCTDTTAHQGVLFLPQQLAPDIVKAIQADEMAYARLIEPALAEEATFPANTNPAWICVHGMKATTAIRIGDKLPNWVVSEWDWPALRQKVRAEARISASKMLTDVSKK